MKSGIEHAVPTVPVTLSAFTSQELHNLTHGNAFPAEPVERQLFYRDDEHLWYQYDGTAWRAKATKTYVDTKIAADIATHAALTTGVHGFNKSARVYHSVAQSIPHNTGIQLAFDSERWDTDAIHDPVTNNSRLTCKTAGVYFIAGHVDWASSTVGRRILILCLNGVTYIARQEIGIGAGGYSFNNVATIYNLAVNDYVELRVYQDSGGALDIKVTPAISPEFMMARIA